MTLKFFEGPAGCGKTTRLFAELEERLSANPLAEHESVLALTKMHGSRRRLHARLSAIPGVRGRFVCTTVDAFAASIVRRWRSLNAAIGGPDFAYGDYDQTCTCAGELLARPIVSRWVAKSHPVVIIDEMQDSKDGQLAVVQELSSVALCLAAADGFQDLSDTGDNTAVEWARSYGEVETLETIHRTSVPALLAGAGAVRDGAAVRNGGGFKLLGAFNHNVGASHLSRTLTYWRQYSDIAVISPARPTESAFVCQVLQRTASGPFTDKKTQTTFGPHHVLWERSGEELEAELLAALDLPEDEGAPVAATALFAVEHPRMATIHRWCDWQKRLTGRVSFPAREIRAIASLACQRARAHSNRTRRVAAMTIHQAKNREFAGVVALWPYEVSGCPARQRRLLYNAITRAKRSAVVIVQNPDRMAGPPFTA